MTLRRLYLALLAVLVVVAASPPYFIEAFELKVYDLMMRYSAPNKPDPRVVIVGIDQKSLDTFGRWPWDRDVIGRLISKMADYGAEVSVLDITFSTEVDMEAASFVDKLAGELEKGDPRRELPRLHELMEEAKDSLAKDERLAASIRGAGNVVTGYLFHGKDVEAPGAGKPGADSKDDIIRPHRIKLVQRSEDSRDAHIWFKVSQVEPNIRVVQEASAASGFLNAWPDEDGVIRSHPMVMEYQDAIYPSLALSAAALYMGAHKDLQVVFDGGMLAGVYMRDSFIPLDSHGRFYLRYHGEDSTFPVISAADILQGEPDDTELRHALGGRIAIVGATAAQIYDLRVTPFGFTAGVEVQANAIANALKGEQVSKHAWQKLYDVALTIIIGLALLFILQHVRVSIGVFLTLSMFIVLIWFNYQALSVQALWLNTVTPGLTIILGFITVTVWQYVSEQESKRFIHEAFGRYLSPKVISQIIDNPGVLKLGGEKRVMTAFFSDVAGFTNISEKLPPPKLVALLNSYLSEMSNIIHELDGTVDKYEGDAIIAFWGAPIPIENHAELCVLAAVRQQRKLVELREQWRKQGKDELNVRMGINTGPMVVGNMGSKERMDYTIMGDSVNLAARLEGANKYYGSNVMVSEFTREHVAEKFLCREVDMVRVQGKEDAIRLYEVVEEVGRITEPQRRFQRMFAQALTTFRRMEFREATLLFETCNKLRPGGDTACKLYIKRCSELMETPPPEDWDRVYDIAK